jgi:hypothetical protein
MAVPIAPAAIPTPPMMPTATALAATTGSATTIKAARAITPKTIPAIAHPSAFAFAAVSDRFLAAIHRLHAAYAKLGVRGPRGALVLRRGLWLGRARCNAIVCPAGTPYSLPGFGSPERF